MFKNLAFLPVLLGTVHAGTILWNGSFNPYTNVSVFDDWSWADEVGTYQWYIHGTEPTSHYLDLSPTYKNPALTSENNGLRVTIDSTAMWNSDMERTELIPQTTEKYNIRMMLAFPAELIVSLGTGNLFYHFTVMRSDTNAPDSTLEHQVMFFESHFTELKYGVGTTPTDLTWMVTSVSQWSTPFTAGTFFNFAYDIDFSAQTVGLWASTGSSPLVKVVDNVAAATSTNSEDFHVGVLRIVSTPAPEDWYISGVYIENGPITTTIGSGASSSGSGTTVVATSTSATVASSSTASATSSATGPLQTQWGQCGGIGYTGATTCASPYACQVINSYYSQCT